MDDTYVPSAGIAEGVKGALPEGAGDWFQVTPDIRVCRVNRPGKFFGDGVPAFRPESAWDRIWLCRYIEDIRQCGIPTKSIEVLDRPGLWEQRDRVPRTKHVRLNGLEVILQCGGGRQRREAVLKHLRANGVIPATTWSRKPKPRTPLPRDLCVPVVLVPERGDVGAEEKALGGGEHGDGHRHGQESETVPEGESTRGTPPGLSANDVGERETTQSSGRREAENAPANA